MLSLSNISKSFGERTLFSGVSFNVGPRERIGLIGPNGSGKTTLFEIITGNILPDTGQISKRKDVTIGYARQEVTPSSEERLLDHVVRSSNKLAGIEHRIQVLQEGLSEDGGGDDSAELLEELGDLQHRFETAGGYNVVHEAEVVLCGLGFKTSDFDRRLNEFSGGWLMRVALAKLLALNPDLLLLDEPTNHLDLQSCLWFEDYLKTYQGAVLLTSHDRAFLDRVALKIISIEKDDVIFFTGGYDDFVVSRQKDLEALAASAKRQEKKMKQEMRFIEKFRYKATKAGQVQSRLKQIAKIERVEVPRASAKIHFTFPEPARSGDEVIELKHISKSYADFVVYRDLNLTLKRGDRVALVGANGAGKTTLLKILAGVLPFEGGERKLGHNVNTAYYAQYQLELLMPENTVLEEIKRAAPGEQEQKLRALLGAFLFRGDDAYKKVAVLSGGEKSRLSIAKMLVRPANFLLMDEPTNHLDINSREMLSDALDAYHGTLCFITHDRTIIREIANKIIEVRNGEPVVFIGNYDEYLAWAETARAKPETCADEENLKGLSPREFERQRKAAEGDLRNKFSRLITPLKKRINEIESALVSQENEFRYLEAYFAAPDKYGDNAEIKTNTRRHNELKKSIAKLTEEWESLSVEAENKRLEFEEAKRALETEYGRKGSGVSSKS